MLSFRPDGRWRGTGILFKDTSWKIVRRISADRGCWFGVRHVVFGNEAWVGSAHFDPGCTQATHRAAADELLSKLRPTTLPIILACDINAPLKWEQTTDGSLQPVGRDGKTVGFLECTTSRGLQLVAPRPQDVNTPTSRPRQEGRAGRQIDCICVKGVLTPALEIVKDTCFSLGTDLELLRCRVQMRAERQRKTHNTRPRVWVSGPPLIEKIDQDILKTMAKQCTKPKPGRAYRDPTSVKEAVRQARVLRSPEKWKEVQKLRRQARKAWEGQRIKDAMEGDWEQVRKLRAVKNTGWDVHYAEQQETKGAHQSIHDHLEKIYSTGNQLPDLTPWQGDVQAFTEDELKNALSAGHRNKAVGVDLTSHELLQGICSTPGGLTHLLEFYNGILCTAEIPSDWNRAIMVVIPKVTFPSQPGELRPLSMGSAAAKVFARMLLTRSEPLIKLKGPEQCSGKGRQACDFIFVVSRLMQLEQEWKQGACWLKVDLAKAFDTVNRRVLTEKLLQRMGMCPEYRCWYNLLQGTDAVLQTGWDCSILEMHDGIKQGAIESPAFFSFLAETCLREASDRYKWQDLANTFPGSISTTFSTWTMACSGVKGLKGLNEDWHNGG